MIELNTVELNLVVALFFSKIERSDENGCWLWTGAKKENGYTTLYINRRPVYAHRWSYEFHKGAIPDGRVIDHTCKVRHCVNPAHLEAVPQGTNVKRGDSPSSRNREKTHCKHGHPFDEANTQIDKQGYRRCKTCLREAQKRRYIPAPKAERTHCSKGHPLTEENRYPSSRSRTCRLCHLEKTHLRHQGIAAPSTHLKMHCKHGHPFDEDNTYIRANGHRGCLACRNAHRQPSRPSDRYTKKQWKELKAFYDYTCLGCGRREPEIQLTEDHIIPRSKGGLHTIENIQPLCLSCNACKGDKVVDYRNMTAMEQRERDRHAQRMEVASLGDNRSFSLIR